MRNYLKYTLLTWALFLSAATATTLHVPGDYPSIQAALTAAQSGDTVLVQPGTYYENIFWPDVNGIKLISAGDSSNTIIDGSGNGSVIYLNPSTATIDSTTEIRGFKITNGGNIAGGGIFIYYASPVLARLWVTGNTTTLSGGGLSIYEGSPTLTYVTVSGNTAFSGHGGGLEISGGSPTLMHVTVSGNTASVCGGGLFIYEGSPALTDVTVNGNTADYGGGLFIQYGSPALMDVTVTGNTANYGGGLNIQIGSPTLTDVTVTDNTATYSGGGLFITYSSPTLTDAIVTGNAASSGGGLYIYNSSPTLVRSTVSRNLGEGLYFSSGSGALVNVTITGNTSGIYVESGAPTIAGSNIAYNGTGVYNADDTTIVDADSVWWGDPSGPYHPQDNPGGLGDSVNAYVNITPFLMEPNTAAPPIPVQNLTVAGTSNDFISLTWDTSPISDFEGYIVYYDTDYTGFPYADKIDIGNTTSYTLSGLSTGLTYYVAATCYDTDGNESWYSKEANTTPKDVTAPAAPKNLVAEAEDGQVILTWDKNKESDFLRYRIYGGSTANPATGIDSTESDFDTTRTISGLYNGTTYYYRVTAIDTSGNESGFSNEVNVTPTALAIEESSGIPASFALHANYPNPFNPVTTIRYDLPEQSEVALVVYDIMGREIIRLVNSHLEAGYRRIMWDAKDRTGRSVPSGIYIARMSIIPPTAGVTPEYTKSIKMVLLR